MVSNIPQLLTEIFSVLQIKYFRYVYIINVYLTNRSLCEDKRTWAFSSLFLRSQSSVTKYFHFEIHFKWQKLLRHYMQISFFMALLLLTYGYRIFLPFFFMSGFKTLINKWKRKKIGLRISSLEWLYLLIPVFISTVTETVPVYM